MAATITPCREGSHKLRVKNLVFNREVLKSLGTTVLKFSQLSLTLPSPSYISKDTNLCIIIHPPPISLYVYSVSRGWLHSCK